MQEIMKLIKADREKKQDKYIARRYYKGEKPQDKQKYVDVVNSSGDIVTMKTDTGCRLYTNYFKLLVNQKINYLLAKEPTIKENEYLSTVKITDMLEDLMLSASLDSIAWLHFFVNDGRLDWVIVSDNEIIPIYDKFNKNIIEIIRYYKINDKVIQVEQWTLQDLKISQIEENKVINSYDSNHYSEIKIYKGAVESESGRNFPFIPFIPLFNNQNKESDLEGIQGLLDMYTSISSGFIDNVYTFQEAIVKLKGFTGSTDALEETLENMRRYKIAGVPHDGDMEYLAVEIPVEARRVLLDLLKDNIFKIGQGLDPDKIGDGNLTNVVIKSRYSQLDMKANGAEKQLKLFFDKFCEDISNFYNTQTDKTITFNRSMLFNESEQIESCVKSIQLINSGVLSKETVITNNPWVKDLKKEMEKIKKEKTEAMERIKEAQETMSNNNENENNNKDDAKDTSNNLNKQQQPPSE